MIPPYLLHTCFAFAYQFSTIIIVGYVALAIIRVVLPSSCHPVFILSDPFLVYLLDDHMHGLFCRTCIQEGSFGSDGPSFGLVQRAQL